MSHEGNRRQMEPSGISLRSRQNRSGQNYIFEIEIASTSSIVAGYLTGLPLQKCTVYVLQECSTYILYEYGAWNITLRYEQRLRNEDVSDIRFV